MKRIKKFNDFDDLDFISESRVYFLRDLTIKLGELYKNGNEWALKLLSSQGKNIDSDTTFLNLDGDDFSFSKESDLRNILPKFMHADDIEKFFKQVPSGELQLVSNYLGSYEQNEIQNLSNRGKAKMGRIIKKLLPEIPDPQLEYLVNSLKSEQKGYEIKLVKGAEISKYYKKESCDKKLLNYGTLQSSCMMDKSDEKPYIFDIYTKNPEVCQLAVMLNSDGKLAGRALVWKIDEIGKWSTDENNQFYSSFTDWETSKISSGDVEFRKKSNNILLKSKTKDLYFMDRVYYTKDWIGNAFEKWANQNNFMMKIGSGIGYKNNVSYPVLFTKVNKLAYRQFPYMDTFKNYDVQSSTLCNYEVTNRSFGLSSTTGEYHAKGTPGEKAIDKATNYIRRFKDYLN